MTSFQGLNENVETGAGDRVVAPDDADCMRVKNLWNTKNTSAGRTHVHMSRRSTWLRTPPTRDRLSLMKDAYRPTLCSIVQDLVLKPLMFFCIFERMILSSVFKRLSQNRMIFANAGHFCSSLVGDFV